MIERLIQRLLYRYLRNNMMMRMKEKGITWSVVNKVMDACGQKVVTHVIREKGKVIVGFNDKGVKVRLRRPDEVDEVKK